jgi:hypothetical protein
VRTYAYAAAYQVRVDLFAMPVDVDSRTGEPKVAWAKIAIKAAGGNAPARRRLAPPAMRYLFMSSDRLLMVHRVVTNERRHGQVHRVQDRPRLVAVVGGEERRRRHCALHRPAGAPPSPGACPGTGCQGTGRVHFLDDDVFCNGFRRQFGSYDMTCLR